MAKCVAGLLDMSWAYAYQRLGGLSDNRVFEAPTVMLLRDEKTAPCKSPIRYSHGKPLLLLNAFKHFQESYIASDRV